VSGPAQYAALAALEDPQRFVNDIVAEFDKRRKLLCERRNEIDGYSVKLPNEHFAHFPM
jgi:aspartate/methionine/tyrosine aminotransferase